MSDATSSDRLRHGALAMLADGNSVEAVAGVLGVPVAEVMGWRARPADDALAGEARHEPTRHHFTQDLSHGVSVRAKATVIVAMAVLVSVLAWVFAPTLHRPFGDVDRWEDATRAVAIGAAFAAAALALARPQVVLGAHSVRVPGVFGSRSIAYVEIADYTLEAGRRAGYRHRHTGRWLTLHSRRPGTVPLNAWIFDQYAFDPRIVERLHGVVAANRGLAALSPAPPAPQPAGSPPRWRDGDGPSPWVFASAAVMVVFGLAPILGALDPVFESVALRVPPALALQRVAGQVDAVGTCARRTSDGRLPAVFELRVTAPSGPTRLDIPCQVDRATLLRGSHRVEADVDPASAPANRVYRVAVDGRVVLSYGAACALYPQPAQGAWAILAVLASMAVMIVWVFVEVWRKRFDGEDDA